MKNCYIIKSSTLNKNNTLYNSLSELTDNDIFVVGIETIDIKTHDQYKSLLKTNVLHKNWLVLAYRLFCLKQYSRCIVLSDEVSVNKSLDKYFNKIISNKVLFLLPGKKPYSVKSLSLLNTTDCIHGITFEDANNCLKFLSSNYFSGELSIISYLLGMYNQRLYTNNISLTTKLLEKTYGNYKKYVEVATNSLNRLGHVKILGGNSE